MSSWTVCWIGSEGEDRWNRYETAGDVLDCLNIEEAEGGSDFLIIPPRHVTSLDEMDAEHFRELYEAGRFD